MNYNSETINTFLWIFIRYTDRIYWTNVAKLEKIKVSKPHARPFKIVLKWSQKYSFVASIRFENRSLLSCWLVYSQKSFAVVNQINRPFIEAQPASSPISIYEARDDILVNWYMHAIQCECSKPTELIEIYFFPFKFRQFICARQWEIEKEGGRTRAKEFKLRIWIPPRSVVLISNNFRALRIYRIFILRIIYHLLLLWSVWYNFC